MKKILQPTAALILLFVCFLIAEQPVVNAQSGPSSATTDAENGVDTRSQPPARSIPYRNSRRILQDVPVSVSTFSGESIRQTYTTQIEDIKKVTQIAGYTPNGVQTSMNTSFTVRGIGNSPNLTYVNGTRYGQGTERNMFHSQSVISGLNGIPVYAVEQIEVLKGPQGTLFGRNATSGVVNFTTPDRINTRINDGMYKSYYMPQSVERYDYSALQNLQVNNWRNTVDAVKLKGEYTTSLPDMTFGPNGTITGKWYSMMIFLSNKGTTGTGITSSGKQLIRNGIPMTIIIPPGRIITVAASSSIPNTVSPIRMAIRMTS